MNFELSEDQKMIRDTVANFVKKELPIERMRKMRDDELGFSKDVWKQMGELGWLGIGYSEEVGGFGGSAVDVSLVLEQFGTTLVSEPYIGSAVIAGKALELAGSSAQHERWLSSMLEGDSVLALGTVEAQGRYDLTELSSSAKKVDDGYALDIDKRWVLAGHAADAILVSARTSGATGDRDGISLFLIEAGDEGLSRDNLKTMDGGRAAAVRFQGTLPADRLIGEEGKALEVLEKVMDLGAAAACAEGVGVLRTMLDMTVEYLKVREQFGVKIGTFQALQHRAVDMFIETQLATSTGIMAAIKVGEDDATERQRAVSAAKAQLALSGRFVSQQAIQLHGGVGITDEHDIGLYFKRMHVLGVLFGDEVFHVDRYASLPTFTAGV